MKKQARMKRLTKGQEDILLRDGTEQPFSGKLVYTRDRGTYVCAACGNRLFSSGTKFDSGTGWPSFYDVMQESSVTLSEDMSHGMARTEVRCAKCGGHLGHLFDDGPRPTGKRYCVNSISLDFKKED